MTKNLKVQINQWRLNMSKLFTKRIDSCIGVCGKDVCPYGYWTNVNHTKFHCNKEDKDVDFNKKGDVRYDEYIPEWCTLEDAPETDGKVKYEISMQPYYGNKDVIIKTVKAMGIKTSGKTRDSGFRGCNVPVILDIKCTPEQKDELQASLNENATDMFDIYNRCPSCDNIQEKGDNIIWQIK